MRHVIYCSFNYNILYVNQYMNCLVFDILIFSLYYTYKSPGVCAVTLTHGTIIRERHVYPLIK